MEIDIDSTLRGSVFVALCLMFVQMIVFNFMFNTPEDSSIFLHYSVIGGLICAGYSFGITGFMIVYRYYNPITYYRSRRKDHAD